MIRPLPYEEPERLLSVFSTVPERGWTNNVQSIPDFLDIREQSTTMNVATSRGSAYNMSGEDEPERISGNYVSWNFFEVLRVQPVLGRTFRPEEELDGEHRVAVIANALWMRRFASDRDLDAIKRMFLRPECEAHDVFLRTIDFEEVEIILVHETVVLADKAGVVAGLLPKAEGMGRARRHGRLIAPAAMGVRILTRPH